MLFPKTREALVWKKQLEKGGHRGLSETSFHAPGAAGASSQPAKSVLPNVPGTQLGNPDGRALLRLATARRASAGMAGTAALVTPRSSHLLGPSSVASTRTSQGFS